MSTRIMLDLETLGTTPGSAILAIGAVKFGGGHIHSEFYARIDQSSPVARIMTIDPKTVFWWLQQSDAARAEITKPGHPFIDVMQNFFEWVTEDSALEEVEMWGNGAAFDNVLLSAAYERMGLPRPWTFSGDRCYRTVKNLFPDVELIRDGTHHNALDDARSQALHLMKMLPNL